MKKTKLMNLLLTSLFIFVFLSTGVHAKKMGDFFKVKQKSFRVTIKANVTATVFLNGRNIGRTRITIKLKKGTYNLRLDPINKNYDSLSARITVNRNSIFNYNLRKNVYTITFKANQRSKLFINGRETGITPITLQLRKGTYNIKLKSIVKIKKPRPMHKFLKKGKVSFFMGRKKSLQDEINTTITVNKNESFNFFFEKKQEMGYLKLNIPPAARLFINNKKYPPTNANTIALPVGKYNIRINFYGLNTERLIIINSDKVNVITLSLNMDVLVK